MIISIDEKKKLGSTQNKDHITMISIDENKKLGSSKEV